MTKKEAIYLLRNTAWLTPSGTLESVEEAVYMAIEALERMDTHQCVKPTHECVEKQVKGELISREDAIDALNEYFARIGKLKRRGLTKGEKAISLDTVGTIKTLPSAEPKTGKWIEESDNHGHSSYFCSRCGTQEGEPSGFCPNCGARMKGARNERI